MSGSSAGTGASSLSNEPPEAVIGGIISSPSARTPSSAVPQRVRISQTISQSMLMRPVQPVCPSVAWQARIQGTVVLLAEISKDGTVESLRAISGHPLLVPAAIEAVKQWRYKPYLLNGQPLPVETQATVNFVLSRK